VHDSCRHGVYARVSPIVYVTEDVDRSGRGSPDREREAPNYQEGIDHQEAPGPCITVSLVDMRQKYFRATETAGKFPRLNRWITPPGPGEPPMMSLVCALALVVIEKTIDSELDAEREAAAAAAASPEASASPEPDLDRGSDGAGDRGRDKDGDGGTSRNSVSDVKERYKMFGLKQAAAFIGSLPIPPVTGSKQSRVFKNEMKDGQWKTRGHGSRRAQKDARGNARDPRAHDARVHLRDCAQRSRARHPRDSHTHIVPAQQQPRHGTRPLSHHRVLPKIVQSVVPSRDGRQPDQAHRDPPSERRRRGDDCPR
jgi:hypothetical protein